jgi:glycosyltransferase involved in cell wall biosynthesis
MDVAETSLGPGQASTAGSGPAGWPANGAVKCRRPTVSVVIPCYGYGRFLPECVSSILGQQGVEVQVLIIDDASLDDSADVAARLAAEHPQVEFLRHRENQGHIATYNEGLLEWADGDYSILISADDLLTPGSMARATAVLDANPNVGFVYGHPIRWTDGEPRPPARTNATGVTVWPGQRWLEIVCGLGHSVVSSPEVVVRTSLQKTVGGYLPELPHTGDAEMWMRLAVRSDVAFIRGVDQAYYRRHGRQMTVARVTLVDFCQRKEAYDAIFERWSPDIPHADRLRKGFNRRIAREAMWEACRAYDRRQAEPAHISELVDFARSAHPEVDRLPESWGLRWRRRAGPDVCAALRPFMVSVIHRRLRNELWWRHSRRHGV